MATTVLNPVGTVQTVTGLSELVLKMQQAWAAIKLLTAKIDMAVVNKYLTESLDDLIVFLVQQNLSGADKKATVIAEIDKLYDTAITGILPFYLQPFSGWIKNYVINIQMSHLIDFLVAKYQSGSLTPTAKTTMLAKYNLTA